MGFKELKNILSSHSRITKMENNIYECEDKVQANIDKQFKRKRKNKTRK